MERLPRELLVDILAYFTERELLEKLSIVCKRWREYVLRSDLWARVGCRKVHALCSRIIWAAEHDHLDVMDGLVKYYNFHYFKRFKKNTGVNIVDDDRNTLLWRASSNGYFKTVKALLERGASTQSEHGLTSPLWIAASNGHANVCKELIAHNADINFKTREGVTPLWRAVYQTSEECVQVLLKANSNPNHVASWGSVSGSCLYIAASTGNLLILQLLLNYGAVVCHDNSDGALTVACLHGYVEVVKLLLERGATFGNSGKMIFDRMTRNAKIGRERMNEYPDRAFYVDSMLFTVETLKNYTKIGRIMLDYLKEGDIADCEYRDILLGK